MNFLIYLLSEGLTKILPFFTMIVVAKYVDVDSFGQLTLYYIALEILTIVISNNIRATTRIDFFRVSREKYVSSKSTHQIVSCYLAVISLVVLSFFWSLEFIYSFLLVSSAFMKGIAYFVLSDLQCNESAKMYGIYNALPTVCSNILFLGAILSGGGVTYWFYTVFFGSLIQFVFVVKYIINSALFNINIAFSYASIYQEFKKGLVFMPQAIGFWINAATDRTFISLMLGNVMVGYYMFIFQLSTPIIIFSTVINLYLTPKINNLLKLGEIKKIKHMLLKFSLLLLAFALINYFAIEIIIHSFYFEKYSYSLGYVPYVIPALCIQAIYLIYINVFYYIGKEKMVSYLIFLLAILKVIGAYIALNIGGVKGLLYANIILNTCMLILVLNRLKKSFSEVEYEKIS